MISVNANPVFCWGEDDSSLSIKNKAIQDESFCNLKVPVLLISNLKIMKSSFVIRFFSFFLSIFLTVCSASLAAAEIDSSLENSFPVKIEETRGEMTQKQMNDLFGEDPYLGQTSYLQSPDGYNQRQKSK